MNKSIESFRGDFDFLSNFSSHSFRSEDGIRWRTVEHYYQAMKTNDIVERGVIWSSSSPGQAKRYGGSCKMREDWVEIKESVMKKALEYKFNQNQDIKEKLISLKEYVLIEGNTWHDNIWGNCICPKCENIIGQNLLGKVLMEVRDSFIENINNV